MIAGVAIFVSASRHPFTYYLQPMTSASLPTLPIIETRLYAGLVKFMDKAIEEGDLKAFSQLLKLHLKIRALELARERFEFSAAQATLKHAAQINEINAMEELSFDEKADLLRSKLWEHPEEPEVPEEPQMPEEQRESPSVKSPAAPKPQPAAAPAAPAQITRQNKILLHREPLFCSNQNPKRRNEKFQPHYGEIPGHHRT